MLVSLIRLAKITYSILVKSWFPSGFLLPALENVCLFTASVVTASPVNNLAKHSYTHKALVLSLKSTGTLSQTTDTNPSECLLLQIRFWQMYRGAVYSTVLPAQKNPKAFSNKYPNFNNFARPCKRKCYPSAGFWTSTEKMNPLR